MPRLTFATGILGAVCLLLVMGVGMQTAWHPAQAEGGSAAVTSQTTPALTTVPPTVSPLGPSAAVTLDGPSGETALVHTITTADGDRCVVGVGQFSVAVTCQFAQAPAQPAPTAGLVR